MKRPHKHMDMKTVCVGGWYFGSKTITFYRYICVVYDTFWEILGYAFIEQEQLP